MTAFFDEDVTGWHGVHQAFQIREFMTEGLLLTAVNLPPTMLAGMLPAWGRELGELMAGYNRIGAPEVRSPAELRRLLARPVPRRSMQLYSIHLMGTARMSADPRRGVVGSFGEFHSVSGLIVADASLFPGPIGINLMETVIALAMRNAHRLISGG